ncbi:MAG: hypothetical protein M3Y22_15300 [Pseudomonadota bacterium]|nr:hypothetical protein [Pseudomonadota bacterium]
MNADTISDRLAVAISALDAAARYIDDEDTGAEIATIASELAELKLDIERETFRAVAA